MTVGKANIGAADVTTWALSDRLSRPRFIKVEVDAPSEEIFSANGVTVVFTKRYESDTFLD